MKSGVCSLFGLAIVTTLSVSVMQGDEPPERPVFKSPRLEQLAGVPADRFTKIVDHSTAPNKRLAVAIGSKDGTEPNWAKLNHTGRAGIAEVSFVLKSDDDSGAANYLVDLRRNRVVGILDGNYSGTRNEYNHVSYAAFWSPDSRWFLECQDWKWSTGPCTVHRISAEGLPVGRLDLLPLARKFVDQELRERAPSLTPQERDGYGISMTVFGITNDGILTARVSGEKRMALDAKWVFVELSFSARIEPDKNGVLSTHEVEVHKPEADEAEQSDCQGNVSPRAFDRNVESHAMTTTLAMGTTRRPIRYEDNPNTNPSPQSNHHHLRLAQRGIARGLNRD